VKTSLRTNQLAVALMMLTGLAAASCAGSKEIKLESSGDIPAAEAEVAIGSNSNGNTTFDLEVRHLAHPSRVDPEATVYVVWLLGGDSAARAQNMGALMVDDNLNGAYSGVTPLRDFVLSVTAEPSSAESSPTGKALLYTTISTE
jgi:hypothetical protein